MAKIYQVRSSSGYSMPRIPDNWNDSERQFGLGLRDLFDSIFSDQETQDRNTEANGERIDETNEKFDGEVKKINDHLNESDDLLNDTTDRVKEIEERLDAIDGEVDKIYPVGIAVFAGSTAPFDFGTWDAVIDPDTNAQAEFCGKYMWERVG
jgi:hypothetical protein